MDAMGISGMQGKCSCGSFPVGVGNLGPGFYSTPSSTGFLSLLSDRRSNQPWFYASRRREVYEGQAAQDMSNPRPIDDDSPVAPNYLGSQAPDDQRLNTD